MFGHETNAGCGARSGSRSVRCGREAPHGVLQTAVNTEINLKSEVDTREGRVLETLNWAGLGLVRPGNRHANLRGARLSWAKTKHGVCWKQLQCAPIMRPSNLLYTPMSDWYGTGPTT